MTSRVLLVRPTSAPDADRAVLRARGYAVTHEAYLTVTTCRDDGAATRANRLLDSLAPGAWLVLASAAGARALTDLIGREHVCATLEKAAADGARFAAVGPTSAGVLVALGVHEVVTPLGTGTAAGLLARLAQERPARAIIPRSAIADSVIPTTLAARRWSVHTETLYETAAVPSRPTTADQLADGLFDAVVLRSPSAARALHRFTPFLPASVAVVAGGPTTALAAARLGLAVRTVASDSTASAIADAVGAAVGSPT